MRRTASFSDVGLSAGKSRWNWPAERVGKCQEPWQLQEWCLVFLLQRCYGSCYGSCDGSLLVIQVSSPQMAFVNRIFFVGVRFAGSGIFVSEEVCDGSQEGSGFQPERS